MTATSSQQLLLSIGNRCVSGGPKTPVIQSIVAFATVSAYLFGIGASNVNLVGWAITERSVLSQTQATKTDTANHVAKYKIVTVFENMLLIAR